MFKILKIVLIVFVLGGGAYYFLDFDTENNDNNSFIESGKDFGEDLIDVSKDAIQGAKEKLDSNENFQELIK
tara:strand:- start:113 stop:328 length:216 start_codon:yes stop_codon:yes gene_type:complete